MKNLSAAFKDHIAGRVTTIATCWKITRTDGVILGFTSHMDDLVIEGVTYAARAGYTPTSIASNSDLSVDNLDLEGLITDGGITKEDIRAGIYDYADVLIFETDYENPAVSRILRRGNIGELTLRKGIYVTEIRGLAQKLQRNIIRIAMAECDAEVYDDRCKVDPADFQNTGTITGVPSRHIIEVTLDDPAREEGYFSGSKMTFTSGNANGRWMDVKFHKGNQLTFFLSSPYILQVGDTFLIQRGCDRKFETCKLVFNNVLNFRGFHKMPGSNYIKKSAPVKEPVVDDGKK